jgi:hypothetical protein
MNKETMEKVTFLENTAVRIVTVVAIIVFLASAVWQTAAFMQRFEMVERNVEQINSTISVMNSKIVGRTREAWHRDSMARYMIDWKELNQMHNVPNVWDDKYDTKQPPPN